MWPFFSLSNHRTKIHPSWRIPLSFSENKCHRDRGEGAPESHSPAPDLKSLGLSLAGYSLCRSFPPLAPTRRSRYRLLPRGERPGQLGLSLNAWTASHSPACTGLIYPFYAGEAESQVQDSGWGALV